MQDEFQVSKFQCLFDKCNSSLKVWNNFFLKSIKKKLKTLQHQLHSLKFVTSNAQVLKTRIKVERKLNQLLEVKKILWHQRSRSNWLKNGDKNT